MAKQHWKGSVLLAPVPPTLVSCGTAFVIGSEGFGMSRLVSEKCDAMLSLPMRGKVNSLNASVAAGIFMYEAVRQRLAK